MTTERERQEAAARNQPHVYRHHYECDDGEHFSAIALSEPHAFQVLNADRPHMGARYIGATNVALES